MSETLNRERKTTWVHIGLIAFAVIIAYSKVFNAGFLSWDDGEYILQNRAIRGFNVDNIKAWFSRFYVGNYHPLTISSYAIDYMLGGLKPFIYHFTGILLHIGNACLVYLFIKKLQPKVMVALLTALLFALHPMQTESVSWLAERKTVLSALFFLLALLQYINYVKAPTNRKLLWVVIAGTAAMLSKGTAVALPLALIAVDIWLGSSLATLKVWLDKLTLFLVALTIGIVALKAQDSGKFMDTHTAYSAVENIVFAAYAYVQYIVRFFVPARLSAMYPYPEAIGAIQYVFALLAVAIVALAVVAWRKKWLVLCGGILFYTANIIFLLQLIPFGEALMADRYMYLACIGIAYPAVHYLFLFIEQRSKQIVAVGVAGTIAAALSVGTFLRNDVWLSDMNFFNAMLETFPNSAVAQYSVGGMYLKAGDYNTAELHFNRAVRLEPNNYKAWHNKGALHLRQGKAMEALEALDRSIAINHYHKAYFTRALLHQSTGKPALALADIDQVLAVQPQNARAWHIKGNCLEQLGDLQGALTNYNKAIEFYDGEPLFFVRRGLVFSKMKKGQLAISDLEMAVALNPDNGEALYYMGMVKYHAGQNPCADLRNALQHGYPKAQEALARFCKQK